MATRRRTKSAERRGTMLKPTRNGIKTGRQERPLLCGAVDYFAMDPLDWQSALEGLVALGIRYVDTAVPWALHEVRGGELDFGTLDPRLDVKRFLELCHRLGLYAIVRPGPHVNAQLNHFGIPKRVIWDVECQARSSANKPVILPIPPLAFPASSYASEAFLAEASQWLSGVAGALEPLGFPRGPIVMAQIDDGAMFRFRDGVCDFDYHRDAIGGYRRFLQRKYRRLEALRKAYGDPAATFAKIEPPSRLSAPTAIELCRYLDWAEYQEELLEASLGRLRQALSEGGLGKILTGYTLPPAAERTRLDPERLRRVVDVIGLECSGRASEANRRAIARRTSELAVRAEACQSPAFANLAAGFPFYLPPLDAIDNRFCALTALAYGLRGFNVYMAADRDRWIGAPFDARGRRRASANFWERLLSAFERLSFHELSRAASVHIVLPRSLRLLARTLETFEPFAPALDELFAASTEVGCSEEDLGFSEPLLLEAERFLHLFESELHTAGVAHAYGAADVLDFSLKHASWTIVVSTGALEPALVRNVVSAIKRRRVVTLGPHLPERNECMLPLGRPSPILAVQDAPSLSVVACDTAAIARLVKKNVRRLQLPQLKVEPRTLYATVHHDRRGRARALFVINPSNTEAEARIFGDWGRAVDAIDGQPVRSGPEGLRLRLDSRSVRMLELEEQT